MALKNWKLDVTNTKGRYRAKVWLSKKDKGVISINEHDDGWSFNAFPKNGKFVKIEKLGFTKALNRAKSYMKKN